VVPGTQPGISIHGVGEVPGIDIPGADRVETDSGDQRVGLLREVGEGLVEAGLAFDADRGFEAGLGFEAGDLPVEALPEPPWTIEATRASQSGQSSWTRVFPGRGWISFSARSTASRYPGVLTLLPLNRGKSNIAVTALLFCRARRIEGKLTHSFEKKPPPVQTVIRIRGVSLASRPTS
jgi:hypothetical protein